MTQSGAKDTGYFYTPFIKVLPPTINLEDFSIRKGLVARYAKKIINPEFYGTVKLTDTGWLSEPTHPRLVQGWLFDDNEAC